MTASEGRAAADWLGPIRATFEAQKAMAERAMAQLPDGLLHEALDRETNSIAVIARHMAGNLASRFTDFLTSDGEKAWRDRDGEFADRRESRAELMEAWERGWGVLRAALACLVPGDESRTVVIRGEPHSVPLALMRALAHQAYHVGQIVQTARVLASRAGVAWETLTIPRGGTAAFNRSIGFDPGTRGGGRG